MSSQVAKRKNGTEWVQLFVSELNESECMACGRCFKACPSGVMELDYREDDEENEIGFMKIVRDELCIGCQVCSKVCPKNCFSHA